MDWDSYFLTIAQAVALKSKDTSTKVGAIVVGPDKEIRSTGYNGFPRRVKDLPERQDSKCKLFYVAHAEANCVYQAARVGVSLMGCSLYLSTSSVPCAECTKAIIQAGIVRVVGPDKEFPGKSAIWQESIQRAVEMLEEAGVSIIKIKCS